MVKSRLQSLSFGLVDARFFCEDAGDEPLKPTLVPAMQRRRLSSVGKLSVGLLSDLDACLSSTPVVFASAHGEVERCEELLQQLTDSTELSPAAFSMSVHNAAAGVFSIATKNRTVSTTIAAGDDTIYAAMLEAYGLLNSGAPQVAVVYADMLSKIQDTWLPEPPTGNCGLVFLLSLASESSSTLTITKQAESNDSPALLQQVTGIQQAFDQKSTVDLGSLTWSFNA